MGHILDRPDSRFESGNEVDVPDIRLSRAEYQELRDELSSLAAGACPYMDGSGLVGDEYGHLYCRKHELLKKIIDSEVGEG